MSPLHRIALACASAAPLFLPACGGAPLSGPPTLHLGRDECAGCGMIISEDRCSCAVLAQEHGERRHLAFDDIGCMLEFEREHRPDTRVLERYVHDRDSHQWIAADAAAFLVAPPGALATPMGSGIVAFGSREAAERRQAAVGGRVMPWPELARDRSGGPAGALSQEGR
jgi:copper chaperone NosL